MRSVLSVIALILSLPLWAQHPLTTLIADEVAILQEGDTLKVIYTFEGCYGPYHHGEIFMTLKGGEIHSLSKSYSDRSKAPMVESNVVAQGRLVGNLDEAGKKESSEILGNVINFRIMMGEEMLHRGKDRIAQRHFIEVFHPFTSTFQPTQRPLIPKISTGGFVR
ncbi:MAG: hypothetical protein KTR24_07440 [Saprospiraceae bacterium]|nr:hypothetical protein [Saprospiraceae bacterium]